MDKLYNYDELINRIKIKLNHNDPYYSRINNLKEYKDGKHYEGFIHDSLTKISKALEVPLEYFFEEEINDNKKQKISLLTMLSNKLSDNQLDVVIAMVRGLNQLHRVFV